ncbi:TPR repeat-containing protein YrrB [Aquisphaera giovannonii]|uniref:TPR repeat-containing protein YrrB n=1 Tax=Aquisphaera giovannonii TaxID=406548 RepID=A0A5B9W0S6_9BACT|nr:tetratricopeptide repeat-containing glycosyltransferase family protein [Aquisphaera giovannonii]QEH34216.1 TPR repeat-containing protein YrrB [Aquisphaera giovannonii]
MEDRSSGAGVAARPGNARELSLRAAATSLQAGDRERARGILQRLLDAEPYCADAWFLLGVICQGRNDSPAAAEHYERAITLDPSLAEAHNNLGLLVEARRDFPAAERLFREAIRLDGQYAEAFNNLGNVLQDQGRFAEAVMAYRRSLAIRPRFVEALKNLGNAVRALGRLDEALEHVDAALRLDPGHIILHTSRGLLLIQKGDFPAGFAELEWRFRGECLPAHRLGRPEWDGSPLGGRTLLISAEQGFGDTIHFIRYAAEAKRRGARVVVACPPALARILETAPGVDETVDIGGPYPDCDCFAPVMSLARILGTTFDAIPADVPYLAADPGRVAAWREEMAAVVGLKVGVVWQGNPTHTRDGERSFPLACLEHVARLPGVRLFALQKNHGLDQLRDVEGRFDITSLGGRLHDFVDTAAAMRSMDLVISADSSPAHLAGALGVPVWTVLPAVCDWRWMADRDDSPWYPTMRLFRQRKLGDWDELFRRLASALGREFGLSKAG